MDVKHFLDSEYKLIKSEITLTGWLVDQSSGLFILGDHYPEDDNYPYKIKIFNSNIIYPILKIIPSLGGGFSLLFYKTKVTGFIENNNEIRVIEVYIQADRSNNELIKIDINDELIKNCVDQFGDYKFNQSKNSMQDWMI